MKRANVNPNVIQSFTQVQAIKKHLLKGKKINSLEALQEFQCMRLGSRIFDLRGKPHNLPIEKKMITVDPSGKRVAEYRLDRDYLKRYREQKRKK